jgi:hypothetical protein
MRQGGLNPTMAIFDKEFRLAQKEEDSSRLLDFER